jgi:crotonobetainyl-CoA:carnitine CoA-transferase CaiB-like acyl-CoA transferase
MFAFFRAAFRQKTLAEWRQELGDVEICFGPVNTLEETFADPQVRHRQMIVDVGGLKAPAPPIKLSETPASVRSAPPRFGEHTESVLATLGFGQEEIAALRTGGVV